MYIDYKLEGKYVTLRSVEESDAEFVLSVRNDPRISKYLPPLNVTVEQQRQWIAKQRADKDSYYFLWLSSNGTPIGTISLYNIDGNHSEMGRVCSIGEPAANVEAFVLFLDFVFDTIKLDYTTGWVYEQNKAVIALNNAFGMTWTTNETDANGNPFRNCIMYRESYKEKRSKVLKKIKL